MIFLRANAGQLNLALPLQRRGRESRVQQNVGQQVESRVEISAENFGVHAKAVIAAVTVDAAAHGLNLLGNVLGRTPRGAFQQELASELGQAIIVRGFGEHPTLEHCAEFNEWESVVLRSEEHTSELQS